MLANRSIPQCTVLPELGYPDVEAATEWLCAAFGFTLRIGIGNHRAQLNAGDGAVILIELPAGEVPAGHAVMVRVENVDRHWERALQHGAHILRSPADYPYGERQYTVADPAGRRWTFTQSITDVDPRSWGGAPGKL